MSSSSPRPPAASRTVKAAAKSASRVVNDEVPAADGVVVADAELAADAVVTSDAPPAADAEAAGELIGRIPVLSLTPQIEAGRFPVKAVAGEAIPIGATVFREGHDAVAATAVLLDPSGREHSRSAMWPDPLHPGLDRWAGRVLPTSEGLWSFLVEGWADPYATWVHEAVVKIEAHVDEELVLTTGAGLLDQAASRPDLPAGEAKTLQAAAQTARDTTKPIPVRLAAAVSPPVREVLERHPLRRFVSASPPCPLLVERERALVGSWYEIFPRSIGARFDPVTGWVSGTLQTAAAGLDRIAAMGFDVVYLTPIHPIGTSFRKGKNNALTAEPTDPGSPYAIGSPEGGHDAIHPDLGDWADFDAFVARARTLGLEVALDLALQCSPDHPWVKDHPEWFTIRADGTVAYAENPPKKYQDIYPLNFDKDPEGIYAEILRIVRLWISHGVTIFRVDNPHTKPLRFWQRFLAQVAAEHPEVIFLSEAFTRPAMMRTLGAVGFHQSYTYFAWRNTKEEVTTYLEELAGEASATMRPSLWPTTHDILTPYMQHGGVPAYKIRAILAATGAPSWGIYTGYELVENVARPGVEEAIDNEKYEFKERDFSSAPALDMAGLLTDLNRIRRDHIALRRLRNLTIHPTSDGQTVCFSRRTLADESPDGRDDVVIVIINLDPHVTRDAMVWLDLAALGITSDDDWPRFQARDLLTGETFEWSREVFVRLDPHVRPAHVIGVGPVI